MNEVNREVENLKEQIEFLTRLAGELTHEMNNPLSTISLNLQLLIEDFSERDDTLKAVARLKMIQSEVDRLRNLFSDFLQIVRGQKGEVSRFDLNSLIEEIVSFFEAESENRNVRLFPAYSADELEIEGDYNQLKQAFINLIRNALQAIDEAKGGDIFIKLGREGERVIVEVIDTGEGIESDLLENIFQPFFTTRRNGTGLGLPTVKRIIETFGGEIRIFSTPKKGTQVRVSFPSLSGS